MLLQFGVRKCTEVYSVLKCNFKIFLESLACQLMLNDILYETEPTLD